jgi:beta-glucosidase
MALTEFLQRVFSDNYHQAADLRDREWHVRPDDDSRIDFFDKHFEAIREAQKSGVDVRGYVAWTLIDNFEWAEGYSAKFGIVDRWIPFVYGISCPPLTSMIWPVT